jgi:muconate cycloisomerase
MSRGQVVSARVFRPRFPFRLRFAHHLAVRRESKPQVLELELDDGTLGFGEAQPRPYVTGETEASVMEALHRHLAPWVTGRATSHLGDAAALLAGACAAGLREAAPAAFCAVDLALLDAAGRRTGRSVAEVLGGVRRSERPAEGAVVGLLPEAALRLYASRIASRRPRWVKLKVGDGADAARVGLLRRVLGPEVALVLDANAAWSRDEAVARIRGLRGFGIAAVEQPVAREDREGLAQVGERSGVPVVADESLCTHADAMSLLRRGGPVQWNVRVGKCGGLMGALALLRLAAAHGVPCHLGVMVGETALLRAAGRLLAACAPSLGRLESDEGALLARDLGRNDAPLAGPAAALPGGPGLGVDLDREALGASCWSLGRTAAPFEGLEATA